MNNTMNKKPAQDADIIFGFKLGSVRLPIDEVVICPLTGRVLVRDLHLANSKDIHAAVHVARQVPAGKAFGRLAAGCATYVDPDVDAAESR